MHAYDFTVCRRHDINHAPKAPPPPPPNMSKPPQKKDVFTILPKHNDNL